MAKTLDFNKLNRPVLPLVMADEEKTALRVSTPPEELIEELQATLPEMQSILEGEDQESVDLCYDLAARLISCNTSGLKVTAEELRGKYWPKERITNQLYLLAFFSAYADFIREINNEKN